MRVVFTTTLARNFRKSNGHGTKFAHWAYELANRTLQCSRYGLALVSLLSRFPRYLPVFFAREFSSFWPSKSTQNISGNRHFELLHVPTALPTHPSLRARPKDNQGHIGHPL